MDQDGDRDAVGGAHRPQKESKLVSGRPPSPSTSQGSYSTSPLKLWQCTPRPSMAAFTSLSRTSEMGSYRWLKISACSAHETSGISACSACQRRAQHMRWLTAARPPDLS